MMKRILLMSVGILWLSVGMGPELFGQGQQIGLPGHDVASIALHIGALAPLQNLPDGTSFNSGIAGGVSATAWPFRNLGVRGTVMMGQSAGAPGPGSTSPAGLEKPTVGLYSLELAVRQPMANGRFSWFPYLAGGIGGKQYLWSEKFTGVEWDMAFAWTMSGGLDVRPMTSPRLGVVLDVSRFSSKYIWHGFLWDRPGVSDLRVTAGLTLNR